MMDVLRPPILRIQGRRYRKNPSKNKNPVEYEEEQFAATAADDMYADEVCNAFTNIEKTENGYRLAMDVPSVFFKYIIGKKGETKRKIENETQTQIRIPRQGEEGEIVVLGHEKQGVLSIKTRIEVLVDSARQRQPFTHFLSLPVNFTSLQGKFEEFKENVLRFCDGDRGIDSSLFQNPRKLHVTIGTLALLNQAEIERAAILLEQCRRDLVEPIIKNDSLVCMFHGLEYMNDDPAAVDVLYGKLCLQDGADRLQILADQLVSRFVGAGLMQRQYDRVKLHITLMNTLFRKDPSGASVPRANQQRSTHERESFDATNILRLYEGYDFGTCKLHSIHLSQRYSSAHDGYYSCAAKLDLT